MLQATAGQGTCGTQWHAHDEPHGVEPDAPEPDDALVSPAGLLSEADDDSLDAPDEAGDAAEPPPLKSVTYQPEPLS